MKLFKQLWVRGLRRAQDEYQDVQEDIDRSKRSFRSELIVIGVYISLTVLLGIYWSFAPSINSVSQLANNILREQHLTRPHQITVGAATTASLIAVSESLWKKSGGYISNDRLPPGIWLDNMPHWEEGVLFQVRNTTRMLRASFTQASAAEVADENLQKAEARFNYNHNSWAFPATESQYKAGALHLRKYLQRLTTAGNVDASFYADAQHLNDYLAGVDQRLRDLSKHLTASVGPDELSNNLNSPQSKDNTVTIYKATPWYQLDDVFFEARGSAWALSILLRGMKHDFSNALKEKKAQESFEQIIRELDATQKNIYSPIILNGNDFGFVVNHSLLMASYISRAQAAIADCRRLLLKP